MNGVPIAERALEDGDRIKAGLSIFIFLEDKPELTPSSGVLRKETIKSGSTVVLPQHDALYLEPATVVEKPPYRDRALGDLKTLLLIGAAIPSIRDVKALQEELLTRIFDAIPADRGTVLLTDESSDEFLSAICRNRATGNETTMPISQTVSGRC